MNYEFDRSLGRLIEAGTQPLAFLAEVNNMSLSDLFMLLCGEFEAAYDKGGITVENAEICFMSSLAHVRLKPNTDSNSPYPYYPHFKVRAEKEPLTQERAQEIHELLLKHFDADKSISMVEVSHVMNKYGYRKERFGFNKMTNLYLALSGFITVVDTVTNGTPSKDVIIAPMNGPAKQEIQATAPYTFSSVLSELVDTAGASIAAFSRECRKDAATTFEILSDAFLDAYSSGNIREEGTALHFNLDKYTISLVPNQLAGSPYPYYLRFASQAEEVPETEVMTLEDEKEIYRFLIDTFPAGEPIHMAQITQAMNEAGYNKERFGFTKMRDMLATLQRFVFVDDTEIGGASTTFVKISHYSEWDRQISVQKGKMDKLGVPLPKHLNQPNVNLSNTTLSFINQLMCGTKVVPPKSVIDAICTAYDEAEKPDKLFAVGDTFRFDTGLKSWDGEDIAATIKVSDMENVDWWFNWGGRSTANPAAIKAGAELEQFAYLGPWQDFLEKLAKLALPEKWSFKNAAAGDYSILRQYIKFTFHHLDNEDKVLKNQEKTFCAFNTGLVDEHYEAIYACFERQHIPGKQEWRFSDFCIAGASGLGKQLVDCFGNKPPQVASYFEKKEDLLFDVGLVDKVQGIYLDHKHMLVDNVHRLPLEFLTDELRGDVVEGVLRDLKEAPVTEREALYQKLRDLLSENNYLYNRLLNRLKAATDLAVKRVRWNYKTAIPCYYPSRRKMSFMLPLGLVRDNQADIALVVEKNNSGTYQGQTILPLQAAYIDARLICRPDSDWLRTNEISMDGDLDED